MMETLKIDLTAEAASRLRNEAARRNASAEDFAARLLTDRLRFPMSGEFDLSPEEEQFCVDAVHEARGEKPGD